MTNRIYMIFALIEFVVALIAADLGNVCFTILFCTLILCTFIRGLFDLIFEDEEDEE